MPPDAEARFSPPRLASTRSQRRKALATLATAQYGVVSRTELRALGYGSSAIGNLVAEGTLHRKTHAVYAVGHPHLTREGWWSLAVRVGGEGTLLSHRAATGVRGLLRAVDTTDIIVPGICGLKLSHIRPHQCVVDDVDRDDVHGLPVTSLGRTLLDIAARHPWQLVEALEQAVLLEVYDHVAILDVIRRHHGYRGVARLRAAIAELPDDPAQFRSRSERSARDLIVSADLPDPVVNGWFAAGASGGYELDLWWPGLGKNVEIDGPRHDLPWQQTKDRRRDEALRAHGLEIQRHKVELLDHAPELFLAEVRAFLAETR